MTKLRYISICVERYNKVQIRSVSSGAPNQVEAVWMIS